MRIDFNSLAFDFSVESGGNTPSWGTALGQGAGYKIKDGQTFDELAKGMIYKAVAPNTITFTKGRGGRTYKGDDDDSSLVIAAVFDKVYINDRLVTGGRYILLIIKDSSGVHTGRLQLKYGLENTYTNAGISFKNKDFKKLATEQLEIAENACWFIYNISIKKQDELHLRAIIVNREEPAVYENSTKLHESWDALIEEDLKRSASAENITIDQLAIFLEKMYNEPEDTGKAMTPMIFGFKYADVIETNKYSIASIISKTTIPKSYEVEVKKGMNIYKAIQDGEYDLNFDFELNINDVYTYAATSSSAKNKIFFGVPGCGKSYHIEHEILGKNEGSTTYKNYVKVVRTTFYQDYSNTDFVGQILPKVSKNDNEKDIVEYIFNPGPFTLALIQAISHPNKKVALVVEEINRGNAPAIFGDIFQLLDRDENGISEYGIVNVGMMDYLNNYEFIIDGKRVRYRFDEIKIPGNLDIFATMNTSDQNVYTLDTAFTRRWEKERIPNEFGGHDIEKMLVPGLQNCTWGQFVKIINNHIKNNLEGLQVNEDKQVGAFFIKEHDLLKKDETARDEKIKAFAYKVLEYLWDDVSKLDHSIIFNPMYKTFEDLVKGFVKNGVAIFADKIKVELEQE